MISIFGITGETLKKLGPKEAVEVFRDILWCQARRKRVPISKIKISSNISVADGGIDAFIDRDAFKGSDDVLVCGGSYYQIKTGTNTKPWQQSWVKEELFDDREVNKSNLGSTVKHCLETNGRYVLVCFGTSLNPQQVIESRKIFVKFFQQCGFDNPILDVWGQDQIVGFISEYPSLCLKILGRSALKFQNYESWKESSDMAVSIHLGDAQKELINEVRSYIRQNEISHIRFIGEPGLGKTRLVLESLAPADISPLVMYVPHAEDFQRSQLYNELLRPDNTYYGILVIDECPSKERASIWNVLKTRSDRFKLVTIDHGPEDISDDATIVMDCPRLPVEQIALIIQDYIQSKSDSQRWASICDGSPRVAHALGQNLKLNPEDILKSPATVDIWGRFIAGYDNINSVDVQQRTVVLRHLALFVKFGFKQPVENEAQFIAGLAEKVNPNITWPKFSSIVYELRKRRILQGKTTLFIVPKALHIYLWLEFWNHYGGSFSLSNILTELPVTLRGWFISMFLYGHKSETAEEQIEEVLSLSGPFSDRSFVGSEIGCKFLNVLAEACPELTLSCIKRTIGTWSYEELLSFTSGRQYIVWALEKMAIWPELFSGAAEVLLKLGEAENSSNANNASGVFSGLFSLGYGPMATTEASPEKRMPVLRAALESDTLKKRQLALKACEMALSTYNRAKMVGPEYQGLRPTAKLWTPKIWGELYEAYKAVWELLVETRGKWKGEERTHASNVLISAASGLIRNKYLSEMVFNTLNELVDDETTNLSSMLGFVTGQFRYQQENLDESIIENLKQLNYKITGSTFKTKLKRYVLLGNWDDFLDKEGELSKDFEQNINNLVADSLTEPQQIFDELPSLIEGDGIALGRFGYELGKKDKDRAFKEKVVKAQISRAGSATTLFLGGYLRAIFEEEIEEWETTVISLLSESVLKNSIVELIWRSGLSNNVFEKLIEASDKDLVDLNQFRMLSHSRELHKIDEKHISLLIERLTRKNESTSICSALEITYSYYIQGDFKYKLPKDVVFDLLVKGASIDEFIDSMDDYYWSSIAEKYIEKYDEKAYELFEELLKNYNKCWRMFSYRSDKAKDLITKIVNSNPSKCWSILTSLLDNLEDDKAHSIHFFLESEVSFEDEAVCGPISLFPIGDVLDWIEEKSESRAHYIARVVPKTLDRSEGGTLTRELLVRHGDIDSVRNGLYSHFFCGGWCGHRSVHYRKKRDTARKWLKNESSQNVISWINKYISILSEEIKQAEIEEEREF